MPRRIRNTVELPRQSFKNLAEELAAELKSHRDSGQPVVDEEVFPTGNIRVNVIWDKWEHLSLEDRTGVILRAYDLAEGTGYRNRIALATGLTVPEARAAGMLPFQIIPGVRKGDPITREECYKAMVEEGASVLADREKPQLQFETEEEANQSCQRLVKRLPKSKGTWIILQEPGQVEGWGLSDSD